MTLNDYSDYDAERGFASCTRDEDEMCFEIWAYAMEKGVSDEHFKDLAIREYFVAFKLAEREDDYGMFGAMNRLPKDWKEQNPNFVKAVLFCCDTPARGREWVDRLVKAHKFRKLQELSLKIQDDVNQAGKLDDPTKIAVKLEEELTTLIEPDSKTLVSAKELAEATNFAIKQERDLGGASIQTQIPFLNSILDGGFRAGQMVVVAARPSIGKTTFSMNVAHHSACKGKKVLFFSLEMSKDQLGKKLAAIDQGVNLSKFAERRENDEDRKLLQRGLENISELPIWVDDNPGQTISMIRAQAKTMNRRHDLDAIYIDYLGLLEPEDKRDVREQQVAQISKACKRLAKELNLVVFLICQLNRDSAKSGSVPQLHHLRESGQIEQDADIVLMLHREMKAGGDTETTDIIINKNRFGPIGHTKDRVTFDRFTQRFRQKAEEPRLHDREKTPRKAVKASQSDFKYEPLVSDRLG
jgi:replicative DNA helicase